MKPYCIYFMQAGKGPIKIGRSDDPGKRIEAVQMYNAQQVTLLGYRQTDFVDHGWFTESNMHIAFREDQIRGEWFRASQRLKKMVSAVQCGAPWEAIRGIMMPDGKLIAPSIPTVPRGKYTKRKNSGPRVPAHVAKAMIIDTLRKYPHSSVIACGLAGISRRTMYGWRDTDPKFARRLVWASEQLELPVEDREGHCFVELAMEFKS